MEYFPFFATLLLLICVIPGAAAYQSPPFINIAPIITSSREISTLVPQNTSLPGQWVYQRCVTEPVAAHVFPYQIINADNNTADACLSLCSSFGFPAAGMEAGDQCWCGDVEDVARNGGQDAPASSCDIACSGDPAHSCGGSASLQLYLWNGTLNDWHQPTNIGQYEFFIPGLVPPLLAAVGINGKVIFLEKFANQTFVFLNSTGAYELDLSLVPDFSTAWREMHVKTDVFCSGAIILPDKGARIINVGGWSNVTELDVPGGGRNSSVFGVRLYTPDGAPGVNGTNDWEENVDVLSLQVPRWYPSVLLMPNGSILIAGGEIGTVGPPDPTFEILPRHPGGSTLKFAEYLNRTDPNNLYPFMYVLPSGHIFIGYYNEARILDAGTLDTVQVLPNMPGAVNNSLAGRSYPLEGSAFMLPLHAPYTDPVTVLVCGGSDFGAALDNCVSIQPEVANATWAIGRMPSRRVMPCMVALPDGAYIIMNGAQQGVAGLFGKASNPNLSALLYDPTQPLGHRISILNTTTIARLYHSEATLLPDGRVLVSGSDPEAAPFPEELRIEVFTPPYLNEGHTQPSFNITETDWEYGGQYSIDVQLNHGTTSTMRVSLIAATASTHGNAMGGRTIFPEFSCAGTVCTITAPPNAFISPPGWHQLFILDEPTPSVSHFVRIGGDPGSLGNWPNAPGFTVPGV
ncbi:copper radical oxidase [Amylostereum chailletii]|nr:copper radical oxidase [Amylostereum chailletii]